MPDRDSDIAKVAEARRRTAAVSRISVGLIVAWTVLIAIPGAVPWTATDDTARALAAGIGIASIVALVGLTLAFVRTDQLGNEGAALGIVTVAVAITFAALQVINLMLIPEDADYRRLAIGVGLLVLLAVGLVIVAAVRTSVFEGFRFSSLSIVGTIVGGALLVVYLLMVQSLLDR